MMKPKANTANTAKMAKRLLSYIISRYKATFAAVLFCIFVSAGATVASSLFLKTLVDGYITPLLTTGSTDFRGWAAFDPDSRGDLSVRRTRHAAV